MPLNSVRAKLDSLEISSVADAAVSLSELIDEVDGFLLRFCEQVDLFQSGAIGHSNHDERTQSEHQRQQEQRLHEEQQEICRQQEQIAEQLLRLEQAWDELEKEKREFLDTRIADPKRNTVTQSMAKKHSIEPDKTVELESDFGDSSKRSIEEFQRLKQELLSAQSFHNRKA
ncbi:MAG: hypothetical protein AAF483_10935 [Planctomycetota bacterium]